MTVLVIQPAALDNWMLSTSPTSQYSTQVTWRCGKQSPSSIYRGLIRFDLSALPENAVISSCILQTFVSYDGATVGSTFFLYRSLRAFDGTSCWNNWKTGNAWTSGGADGAGTDREASPIGSLVNTASMSGLVTWNLTPTTKAALDLGYGWVSKSNVENSDAYQYRSSEYVTILANRPKLTITYDVPPTAPSGLTAAECP